MSHSDYEYREDAKPYAADMVECADCGRTGQPALTSKWGGRYYCGNCRPECCQECGEPLERGTEDAHVCG